MSWWHGLSHSVPRKGSYRMPGEWCRVKKDMEGAGMLPWGRSEWRWVTVAYLWQVEQNLPPLGLWGLRVISFPDGLCIIDEIGSRQ